MPARDAYRQCRSSTRKIMSRLRMGCIVWCLGGQQTDDQALRLGLQERMRLEDQQGRYPLGTGPTLYLLRDAEDTRFELVRACTQHAFQFCVSAFTPVRQRPLPAQRAAGYRPQRSGTE